MEEKEPYHIEFEYNKDYLHAHVTGEKASVANSLIYWNVILAEVKKKGYHKVLISEDFKEYIASFDMFLLAGEVSRMGFDGIKIAFADHRLDHLELNKYGETIATNRGIDGRVFTTIEEAERWLLSYV